MSKPVESSHGVCVSVQGLIDNGTCFAPGIQQEGIGAIVSKNVKFESVVMALQTLVAMQTITPWCIGDICNQAAAFLPDEYSQIISMVGLSNSTITTYRYVAKAYDIDERVDRPLGVHQVVAGMEDRGARNALLQEAVDRDMSYHDFIQYVKAESGAGTGGEEDYGDYGISIVRGDVTDESISEAMVDARPLSGKDLMALGIVPVKNDESCYVIRLMPKSEKIATGISEGNGFVTEQVPEVGAAGVHVDNRTDEDLIAELRDMAADGFAVTVESVINHFGIIHLRASHLMINFHDAEPVVAPFA